MSKRRIKPPPRWLFLIFAVGGLLASGIYIGIIHSEGTSTWDIVRAIGYGIFGVLMLWRAFGKR